MAQKEGTGKMPSDAARRAEVGDDAVLVEVDEKVAALADLLLGQEPLSVEATTLEGTGPDGAVYDDDFIRSRRAANSVKRRIAALADVEAPSALAARSYDGFASEKPMDSEGFSAEGFSDAEFAEGEYSAAGYPAGDYTSGDFDDPEAVFDPEDGLSERIVASRTRWRGQFLRIDEVAAITPDGRCARRDVVRHPGGVVVVALTDDSQVVVVHQYRTAIEQVTVELPAGKLDLGEDPRAAAARELEEETGYVAERMAYLGPIAPAPGYSDELLHVYLAMGLSFVGAKPDDDEFLQVDLVSLDKMVDDVLDGKIVDAKTIVGVLLCDAIGRRMAQAD